ncbi:MAG: asparagine synthase (glutamine-hydrolyzing) [Tepidisphaeraceae bacterium]
MCGIAGVMTWNDRHSLTEPLLRRMAAAIAHRGPDGEAIHLAPTRGGGPGQVGLAFRRLAVLDPNPRAMQPMSTDDRRCTIAFNGEIYNYKELRQRCSADPFHTSGDTEVLLRLLAERGFDALDELNGMFAIAFWNATDRSLLLIRDRMGQKPLYYTLGRGSIAFASELAALASWPDWDRTIDDAALTHYLEFGRIDAPRTIYRGVRQLEPGTWLRISADGTIHGPVRYFDPNVIADAPQTQAANVRAVVERAVERQLVSDVPLGVFLSGGIDSSIIAACARRHGPVQTFSIGFDDPRYDETAFAERVAKHLGTDHHTFRVKPDAAADLPLLAGVFGEPFGDSSALPTHYLARETRKHVTVALSGDGGDELFGGYDRYRAVSMNLRPFAPLAPLGTLLARGHPKSRITRVGRLVRSASLPPWPRYRQYMTLFDRPTIISLLGDRATFDEDNRFEALLAAGREPAESAAAYDRLSYLPNDLLTKVDRCSMLHALEVRSPFMDHDLVRLAAGLRTPQLFRGGPKRLLREAFAADLPAEVFSRRKMGFAVPIGDWLRDALKPQLHELSARWSQVTTEQSSGPMIDRLVQEHVAGRHDHSQRLYVLIMLSHWLKQARFSPENA